MASTVLADVKFQSNVFLTEMQGAFTHRLALLNSGIMSPVPDSILSQSFKGVTWSVPVWKTLEGDPDVITTTLDTTINSLGQYQDIGIFLEREKAWGANEIVKVVSGRDATREIARQLGYYWAGEAHRYGLLVLKGVFATALASTHSTGTTFSGGTISVDGVLTAKQLLGDNMDFLTDIVVNSKVNTNAVNDKILTYDKAEADTYVTGNVPRILGLDVHVSDKLAAVDSVYPSYLSAKGAILYKFRERDKNMFNNANIITVNGNGADQFNSGAGLIVDVELARNSVKAGGQDYLISRASFTVHVPGVKTTLTSSEATDGQLGTGSNWEKVVDDDKLIRIVELKTL